MIRKISSLCLLTVGIGFGVLVIYADAIAEQSPELYIRCKTDKGDDIYSIDTKNNLLRIWNNNKGIFENVCSAQHQSCEIDDSYFQIRYDEVMHVTWTISRMSGAYKVVGVDGAGKTFDSSTGECGKTTNPASGLGRKF